MIFCFLSFLFGSLDYSMEFGIGVLCWNAICSLPRSLDSNMTLWRATRGAGLWTGDHHIGHPKYQVTLRSSSRGHAVGHLVAVDKMLAIPVRGS